VGEEAKRTERFELRLTPRERAELDGLARREGRTSANALRHLLHEAVSTGCHGEG